MIATTILKSYKNISLLMYTCRNHDALLNFYTSTHEKSITYTFIDQSRIKITKTKKDIKND